MSENNHFHPLIAEINYAQLQPAIWRTKDYQSWNEELSDELGISQLQNPCSCNIVTSYFILITNKKEIKDNKSFQTHSDMQVLLVIEKLKKKDKL